MEIKAPRGTNDIMPDQAKSWYELEKKAVSLFERYGYGRIVTPTFENTALFERGIGESTEIVQKEMYTFTDKGGRSITLRPEGTAPVVRAYLEHNLSGQPMPVKLYYLGSMYRYERPQAGRCREFWQVGVEAIGSADPAIDAENILLLIHYLDYVGISDLKLLINSMGCEKCRPDFVSDIKKKLGKSKDLLCNDCKRRAEQNPLRVFDCKKSKCREALKKAPKISNYLCDSCSGHFDQVKSFLKEAKLSFEQDPWLVRGFDYYTKTTFEVISEELGAQNALGGGGRYDGLIEEFGGASTPAIGFAIGIERVLLALSKQQKKEKKMPGLQVFVIALGEKAKQKTFRLIYDLRKVGISADMDFQERSLKGQMKLANKRNAEFTVIIGSDELERNVCGIRNMEIGSQDEIELDKCVDWFEVNLCKKEQNIEKK